MKKFKILLIALCLVFFATQVFAQAINGTQYVEGKQKGLVKIVKIGNSYAMVVKRFNEYDGSEGEPNLYAVTIEQLQIRKQWIQNEWQNLQILIDDLEALQAVEP